MNISEIHLLTFSPTHTSQRVGEAIVHGTAISCVKTVDLTLAEVAPYTVPAHALAIITVPVYGGRVAPLALQRLAAIQADGAPAVIVVVYGNRAYEQALIQLDDFATSQGFKVISGATFVGEHSYSTAQHPIAVGRPDADDLDFAREYGEKIRTKIEQASDADHLYGVDVKRIQRPSQPLFPMFRFIWQLMKWRKQGMALPRTPQTDAEKCTRCGACAAVCPSGAIRVGDELQTDADKCIKCCACVKECPQQARTYDTPFAPLLSANFQKRKQNRIIL